MLSLAAFAAAASITPGPNNLMLLASGANFGLRRTLPHMIGVTLGHMAMILILGAGLAEAFALWPRLQLLLKIAFAGFMLPLAWRIANAAPPPGHGRQATGQPLTLLQAALFQWVNPKAWAMALGALAVYAPAGSGMAGVSIVAGTFTLVNLPSVTCWVVIGTQIRGLLDVPWKRRLFNGMAALLLLGSLWPILAGAPPN